MADKNGHLLLVDDQPANLEVLSRVLSDNGYQVRAVTSGARAIEAASAAPPECILLDVAMPDMDGFQTCRALAEVPELAAVPVIFITAFDDAEHKAQAFAAGGRDYVTKPFQSEEVLARVSSQVRLFRAERELREQNARLTSANAQLEEMAAMRSRISAMLVHDIKSPLTVIGAVLELPPDPESIEDGRVAFQKILRLVHELLELYRDEHRDSDIRREAVELPVLVRAAVSTLRHTARQRGIALEYREGTIPPAIKGDREKLDRVLSNLLENALKFTPREGHVTVSVDIEQGRGPEKGVMYAVFAVNDTGPGIPSKDLPYVFDPYRQRAGGDVKGGVGLGLSIVQRLVAAHGGRVRVLSRMGVGTEFRVLIPL